jgi:hypothetical protein
MTRSSPCTYTALRRLEQTLSLFSCNPSQVSILPSLLVNQRSSGLLPDFAFAVTSVVSTCLCPGRSLDSNDISVRQLGPGTQS